MSAFVQSDADSESAMSSESSDVGIFRDTSADLGELDGALDATQRYQGATDKATHVRQKRHVSEGRHTHEVESSAQPPSMWNAPNVITLARVAVIPVSFWLWSKTNVVSTPVDIGEPQPRG